MKQNQQYFNLFQESTEEKPKMKTEIRNYILINIIFLKRRNDCSNSKIFITPIHKKYLQSRMQIYWFHNLAINLIIQYQKYQNSAMNKQTQLRSENSQLQTVIQNYLSQIQLLKKTNKQHQQQIQTLLKFNERLLIIIQTQLNQYNSKKSERSYSLQPISEITQKDSEAVEALGSIKISIANIKLNQLGGNDKQYSQVNRKTGNETQRVMLGDHLDDVLSYEISRSDYQKEYSQYSRTDKLKEAYALVNAYKQEYGNSIKQCEEINIKIKEDVIIDNHEAQNISNQNTKFYGSKLAELSDLQQKIKDNSSQKELENIIKQNKYSDSTRKRLMKIMGSTK